MAAKKRSGGKSSRAIGSATFTKSSGRSKTRPNTRAVFVAAQRHAEANNAKEKNKRAEVPMKRAAQPEELAPAYVYFAFEDHSRYVSGEVLSVLGGQPTAVS